MAAHTGEKEAVADNRQQSKKTANGEFKLSFFGEIVALGKNLK